jgi:hypothetical protein
MGPGTLLNDTMSDDDNSSTSHRAHSPIQLYENPGKK